MRNYRCHHKLSRFKPIIRSAFEWSSFGNRSDSLKLLRRDRVHVDTILATQDGFTDLIHWQAILALCPSLLEASEVSERAIESNNEAAGQISKTTTKTLRHIELPRCVDSNLAKKLIACAYGEQVELDRIRLIELYRLAEKFKIDYAIIVCLNQGKNLLDIHNCIQLLLLSLRHRHHTLRRTSYSFLRSNFKLVISLNKDFHLLPCEYLKCLLQDDYLKLDEDEEFAWIAILRWLREKPLNEREITDIHNQMTGRINYSSGESFGSWLSNERQQQQLRIRTQPRASNSLSTQRATVQPFAWPMLQILLSPHFRFDSTSWNQNMDSIQKQTSTNSLVMWTESDRAKLWNDRIVDENQLIELVKCLRFMRFRSLDALNLIASCNFVQQSEKLSLLVFNMELRYLIRKRLPVDRQQLEQLIGRETLANIERCESNSATKTMLKKLKDLLSIRPPLQPQQMGLATYKSTIELRGEARKKLAEKLTQQELDEVNQQCLQRSDRPRIPNSVALLVGGWQDGAVSKTMMAYDFVCDKWFKLSIRLPEPRAFHVVCCSPENSQLFIMGGTNGVEILNSVLRFDPSSDVLAAHPSGTTRNSRKTTKKPENGDKVAKQLVYKFHRIKSMRERRCHLSGVYHSDGRLYALGGHNGSQRLRSGEWYSSKSDQWHDIADMTIARSDASACSHENKIFIAGGQIGDQFIQSSVEFYKPSDNTWTFAAPMIVPRMSFQLVSHGSMLLAVGGTIGLMHGDEAASMTRSVEKYNSQLESWSLCAPMIQKRSSFGAFSVDGKLIVAGGHGGSKRLKTCEQLSILNFPEPQQYQHHRQGPTRTLSESDMQNVAHRQQVRPQQQRQEEQRRSPGDSVERPQMLSAASESRINQMFGLRNGSATLRTAMRWVGKAKLPAKRSGFSVCVVQQMNNAKDFTYHGSIRGNKAKRVTAVKQKSRWHRFKIIRRRKLIKHAKIALVLTVIILLM